MSFMANITCNYYSPTLRQNTTIQVVIPTPSSHEPVRTFKTLSSSRYPYDTGFPVVYLLHGTYGDFSSWGRYSNVERYAQEHHCAVIAASAGNSFFQNMHHGYAYRTFFTEELPAFVTSLFPISKKREDTFIAGLSMGGYGAWYLALSAPHVYAKAASLSGALDIALAYETTKKGIVDYTFAWNDIFETPDALSGSDSDLFVLYSRCRKNGLVPELYQACGREDFLYASNLDVNRRMRALHADIVYEEGPGAHTWDFWDTYIRRAMNWMIYGSADAKKK